MESQILEPDVYARVRGNRYEFDRSSLVDILGIEFKSETPSEREKSILKKVDNKLANLFGVKIFFYDSVFEYIYAPSKEYSLSDIEKTLADNHIDIPANDFVNVQMQCTGYNSEFIGFKRLLNSKNNPKFRLTKFGENLSAYFPICDE